MAKKTLDRTVPSVWVRRVPKGKKQVIHEYWVSSWRDRSGKIVNAHLGAVTKVTKEEALAKALQLKTEAVGPLVERQVIQGDLTAAQYAHRDREVVRKYVGKHVHVILKDGSHYDGIATTVRENFLVVGDDEINIMGIMVMRPVQPDPVVQPSDSGAGQNMQPAIDVAKIRAEREAFIAEEIQREAARTTVRACGEGGNKTVACNSCGSDFTAFPGEGIHCPKCCGTDLRYLRYDEHITIAERIFDGALCVQRRRAFATERLKHLGAKKTKFPATLSLPEGWVDANPDTNLLMARYEAGLGEDDNYSWYTRCGEYEMQGFKTPEDGKNGLVSHCKGCAERREGCQMPEVQEPTPETGGKQQEESTENAAFSAEPFINVKITGVTWNKNRQTWELRAYINGKREYIKSFKNKEDAIAASLGEAKKEALRARRSKKRVAAN